MATQNCPDKSPDLPVNSCLCMATMVKIFELIEQLVPQIQAMQTLDGIDPVDQLVDFIRPPVGYPAIDCVLTNTGHPPADPTTVEPGEFYGLGAYIDKMFATGYMLKQIYSPDGTPWTLPPTAKADLDYIKSGTCIDAVWTNWEQIYNCMKDDTGAAFKLSNGQELFYNCPDGHPLTYGMINQLYLMLDCAANYNCYPDCACPTCTNCRFTCDNFMPQMSADTCCTCSGSVSLDITHDSVAGQFLAYTPPNTFTLDRTGWFNYMATTVWPAITAACRANGPVPDTGRCGDVDWSAVTACPSSMDGCCTNDNVSTDISDYNLAASFILYDYTMMLYCNSGDDYVPYYERYLEGLSNLTLTPAAVAAGKAPMPISGARYFITDDPRSYESYLSVSETGPWYGVMTQGAGDPPPCIPFGDMWVEGNDQGQIGGVVCCYNPGWEDLGAAGAKAAAMQACPRLERNVDNTTCRSCLETAGESVMDKAMPGWKTKPCAYELAHGMSMEQSISEHNWRALP